MFIKCTTRNFSCERKKKEICVDAAKSGIHKDYVSFSVVLSFYSSLFCETSNIKKTFKHCESKVEISQRAWKISLREWSEKTLKNLPCILCFVFSSRFFSPNSVSPKHSSQSVRKSHLL